MTKNRSLLYALIMFATLGCASQARANYHVVDTMLPSAALGAAIDWAMTTYNKTDLIPGVPAQWNSTVISGVAGALLHTLRIKVRACRCALTFNGDNIKDSNERKNVRAADKFNSFIYAMLASAAGAAGWSHQDMLTSLVSGK